MFEVYQELKRILATSRIENLEKEFENLNDESEKIIDEKNIKEARTGLRATIYTNVTIFLESTSPDEWVYDCYKKELVHQALKRIFTRPSFKKIEYDFGRTLGKERIEDAREQLRAKIVSNSTLFLNSETPVAWVYQCYRNLLNDVSDKETRRDNEWLDNTIQKMENEILFLKKGAIETDKDLSAELEKKEKKLRSYKRLRSEIEDLANRTTDIAEKGCAFYCLEKLAKDKPGQYALFVAKILDHTPEEIAGVMRGILKENYNPFKGIGQMITKFKTVHAKFATATEASINSLLAESFGYANANAVGAALTQIRGVLQKCVEKCQTKEQQD